MGSLFAPKAPPSVVQRSDKRVEDARQESLAAQRRRAGRRQTILTDASVGDTPAQVQKKTLGA